LALFTLSTSLPVPHPLYHSIFILRGECSSWILRVSKGFPVKNGRTKVLPLRQKIDILA
jgi:hypothetical protein